MKIKVSGQNKEALYAVMNMCAVFLRLLTSCSSAQIYRSLREKLLIRFQNYPHISASRLKGPPCCKIIGTAKEMNPVIFITKFTAPYLPKRQASSFEDKRQGARCPFLPPHPSLAVRRDKVRDNCSILRVGTLDSYRFSIVFLIHSRNGRSNKGSAVCNFLLQMCVDRDSLENLNKEISLPNSSL
jgi:hypothetical protein